jgi:2-oxoglutarate ferredoxin oxidoreductase subunit alpha
MNKILLSGNEAIGQGAIDAGCGFYAGYPITPQNELTAYMAQNMPKHGRIFIQAESELAAINMVYGASAAGARAMTSSSSPGMSLKQEGISYIAGSELPAVIVNVMRGGPGLGNIAPSQSDYFQATRSGGHGDYHCIVLGPASVQECYELMPLGFELADKYRNPVTLLADGMLGQMMEPVLLRPANKRKLPEAKKGWALSGCKGRAPNIIKSFYMREGALEKFNLALQKKYSLIKKQEQRYDGLFLGDARLILVAYGSMSRIARGAVQRLRQGGEKIGLIRPVSLWPFPEGVFLNCLKRAGRRRKISFLVLEMSYGQMLEDVRLAVSGQAKVEFLGRSGGGIPSEAEIINKIKGLLR